MTGENADVEGDSHQDPLDGIEPPPLKDQIAPYEGFGDAELALSLLSYSKKFGGPGATHGSPAASGANYECQTCEKNVRGVSRDTSSILACPLCGETPGMLTLGRGPR